MQQKAAVQSGRVKPRIGRRNPRATLGGLVTTHETAYQALRERILFGTIRPGSPVTLRGLADSLGVSPMPVREAVRRLIAERALELGDNRRVLVPPMTRAKFEQVVYARLALEPELAVRALANLDRKAISTIAAIDNDINDAMRDGDAEAYMRGNYRFHFALYEHAAAPMLISLLDSVWLQFGPFMRSAYGRIGTQTLEDHHEAALKAMRKSDARALKQAICSDIAQGMNYIGESILKRGSA